MKKIRVFETFAGIGAQRKALKNIGLEFEVVGISEWFVNAILAYDKLYEHVKKPVTEKIRNYTLSTDSSNPWNKNNKWYKRKEELAKINARINNFGSILDINGIDMPKNIDLFTYSFPCQDLSTGGKNAGIKRGSNTRSGLLWEVERLLIEMDAENNLPKNLMMENVAPILSTTHKPDFDEWISKLEKLGYKTRVFKLNSKNFGVAQSRVRVFALSSLNHSYIDNVDIKKHMVEMPTPKSFLRDRRKFKEETDEVQLNNTPSREVMWRINGRSKKELESRPFNTITTNMDRQNNAGLIKYKGPKGDTYRMLTPRESFLLMGFTELDFEKIKELGWSWRAYNKIAGNSIVVPVLEAIFKEIKW